MFLSSAFLILLNLVSSLLLFLQCLSKFVALLYHYPILLFYLHQLSLNHPIYFSLEVFHKWPFIISATSYCLLKLLNELFYYSFSLLYSFEFYYFCQFIIFPPNSIFKSFKKSLTNIYSLSFASNSFSMLSFQMSATSPCTYVNTYYTCFSTSSFLILILMYNLQIIIKPTIYTISLLKIDNFAIPPFSSCLEAATSTTICTYITTINSACYLI